MVAVDINDRANGNKVLESKSGHYGGSYGVPGKSMLDYPRYMVIAVGGMEDTYEIREPGPYIYVSEAPPAEKE